MFGAQTGFGIKTNTPTATFGTAAPGIGVPQANTFGFGNQAAAPPATAPNFGFGATATSTATAAPTFNFGSAASTAAPAPTATALPQLNFGGTTTTAAPTLGGLGGSSFFGKPATTTAVPTLNFGTTTVTATPFAAGGGLFGKPTTTPLTAPPPFLGLGGIDVSSTQPKLGDTKQDTVKVRDTQVPDEIAKTVEGLKNYIKVQKTLASDIGRTSTSKLTNVSNHINRMEFSLRDIANSVESNYNQIKLLRRETSKAVQAVEMAQRTHETPAGLQFENTTPCQYFQNLVAKYEQDLLNFRTQIELTERHMRSLANPQNITSEDLKRGFQQINESFIALAGRLQDVHLKIEAQKEQFLNLRKYRLRDSTNVFAHIDNPEVKIDTSRVGSGPTPFSYLFAANKTFSNVNPVTAAGSGSVSTTQPGVKGI